MAYNPYGGNPYGPPPNYNPYPGSNAAPGMGHPGLGMPPYKRQRYGVMPPFSSANQPSSAGPPPGMSSAPGMAPPPGVQQLPSATQANRPSGLPSSFQPPHNLPNINFNAPVIRLGGLSSLPARPNAPQAMGRRDPETPLSAGSGPMRQDFRHDRGGNLEQTRANIRDNMHAQAPPTTDEKLRTIFVHKIPKGVGGERVVERLLGIVGKLSRWDSGKSHLSDHEGELFGFAQFEDADSLASAIELLKDVEVPLKKQELRNEPPEEKDNSDDKDDTFEGIDKVALEIAVDPVSLKYIEAHQEGRSDEAAAEAKAQLEARKAALKAAIHELFYPTREADGDVEMTDVGATSGDGVEVVNIPLAQEDELADIPAEIREIVASEIASFRERSNQRDLERLKKEQEMEEQERRRNGESQAARLSRLDSPPSSTNNIPLGPRSGANHRKNVGFVNGGTNGDHHHHRHEEEDDTDASDDELYRREQRKHTAEDDKLYQEAERKWVNRERQRGAAIDREREREHAEAENADRHKEEQISRDKSWEDERESSRKNHIYYRDHATWLRKRAHDKAEEEARDAADRRAEQDELRKQEAEMETARDMADSFLEKQAHELEVDQDRRAKEQEAAAAPQRFTISFGAAAQKAQAQRGGAAKRTVAEVEGLLDDEEQDGATKRQLVPIKFEPMSATAGMSDEEINQAVRALAQEIPTEKAGLWAWDVKWEFMDDAVIRDKLRPFVEKKVVEYLGVQEQFLVEVVEEHLRKHGKPEDLVEELQEALDEAAEDLVKKLWRMVIFFTESEKRGLPA